MSGEWIKDFENMRGKRWPDSRLDELKANLNSRGMSIISDAIGSLQFDKIDLVNGRGLDSAERGEQ